MSFAQEAPIVRLGDGIAGLCALAGAATLVLTDLPSGETVATFDREPDLGRLWPAVWQALCPTGIAVMMASSLRFAAKLVASQPATFRYDLVWKKNHATGFLNAKMRPLRAHEFVLVFWRSGPVAYASQMSEGHLPMTGNCRDGTGPNTPHGDNYGIADRGKRGRARVGATDRYPISVLDIPGVANNSSTRVHPQQKPDALMRWLVRSYSRPGDLVLDPFAGSGSAGRAALAEGRRFAGWDIDPRFGTFEVEEEEALA